MTILYHCPDCDWTGTSDDIGGLHRLHHIEERISAGELVPAGTCPECRALIEVEDADIPANTLQVVAHAMRKLGWIVNEPETATPNAKPAHQMLAEVLSASSYGTVADEFIIQTVLVAANRTAAHTPDTLVMDDGPISKQDWIGAATAIRDHLTDLVRANVGLEQTYYQTPRWYALACGQSDVEIKEFPTDQARQDWLDHRGFENIDYVTVEVSRDGSLRSAGFGDVGEAIVGMPKP